MHLAALKRPASHNQKISDALRGRPISPEHIEAQRRTKLAKGTWKPIGHSYIRRGYRWIKTSHGKGRANYEAEHRFVMAHFLGRELQSDEHIHHLDGNTLNNTIDNLVLLSNSDHTSITRLLRLIDEPMARTVLVSLKARFPHLGS